MTDQTTVIKDDEDEDRSRRPSRAVVGSHRPEEEMFGKAYDGKIVGRIWAFVRPYRKQMYIAVVAVLVFTLTQLAIPLVIRYAIDHGMKIGESGRATLIWAMLAFGVAILINSSTCGARCSVTCNASRCRSWTRPRSAA